LNAANLCHLLTELRPRILKPREPFGVAIGRSAALRFATLFLLFRKPSVFALWLFALA
jgi:hypothetical protein